MDFLDDLIALFRWLLAKDVKALLPLLIGIPLVLFALVYCSETKERAAAFAIPPAVTNPHGQQNH